MKRQRLALMLVLAALVMLCGGLVVSAGAQGPEPGSPAAIPTRPLVYALEGEPATLDVNLVVWTADQLVVDQLMEGLYRYAPNGSVEPAGATGYTVSAGGRVYTVTLRSDAVWSDGLPVTAQQYVDGILRLLDPATGAGYTWPMFDIEGAEDYHYGAITDPSAVGVKALGAHTLEFTLVGPRGHFPSIMALATTYPVRLDIIGSDPDWTEAGHFVGNGPYLLEEWTHGERLVLTKNPLYHSAPQVAIDSVVFPIIASDVDRLAAYEDDRLDVSTYPPAEVPRILADPVLSAELHRSPRPGLYYLGLNTELTPTNAIPVRQALASAIDRDYILNQVVNEPWKEAMTSAIPPGIPGYQNGAVGHPFDPTQAQIYLAQAGYPGGVGFPGVELWANSSDYHEAVMNEVADRWRTILGITVTTVYTDWDPYLDLVRACDDNPGACDYNAYRLGWTMDYGDAGDILDFAFHPDSEFNYTGWDNARYRELMDLGASETDPGVRMAYFQEADRILVEDEAALIPLFSYDRSILVKSDIQFEYPSLGGPYLMEWAITTVSTATIPTLGGGVASPDGDVEVEFPAGAVAEPVWVTYTDLPSPSVLPPAPCAFAGNAFSLEAATVSGGQEVAAFAQPLTITIDYTDGDLNGADEASLELRYWDGGAWVADGIAVVERDMANNRLVVTVEHLTQFALFSGCQVGVGEWEWQNPLPTGNTLYGVWGSSGSDVFAVGELGTILHYNGTVWSAMNSGTTEWLWGVWGSSGSDVFAVGFTGTIMHYDGTVWSAMSSGTTEWLIGVWGSSSSDVFAVGEGGTILHYDGSLWSAVSSPTSNRLYGVWGSDSSDVFAVGQYGTILHYDGTDWSAMSSGTSAWFTGVWGSSGSDVFAVGDTILHYDGTDWSHMNSGTAGWIEGVWGSSGSDVFAVGGGDIILHYDGAVWGNMSTPTSPALNGVWGSASIDVFAVGRYGTILHYDGMGWSTMGSGTTSHLYGVWGSASIDVFAVGDSGTVLHYDGASWSGMSSGTAQPLFDVWGSSSSDVFAVGWQGTILHYDGVGWSAMSSGTTSHLYGVWGSSGSDVFAVGMDATILHYDGAVWSAMINIPASHLYGVWGSSGSDVLAVGLNGVILGYDGADWSNMGSGTTQMLRGLWGSSSSDVFAVGDLGTILHSPGTGWGAMASGTTNPLRGVWDSSGSDVFAVGGDGTIRHFDGGLWSAMSSGTSHMLYGVWGSNGGNIFAVGEYGTILHHAVPGHQAALSAGWTLLTWPLEPLPDARGALDEIEAQSGHAPDVYRWLSETDTWDGHVKDLPFNNFDLELGQGYFFKATLPSAWWRAGAPPAGPVAVALNPVWTLMGAPVLPCPMTAEDLLVDATAQGGDCTEIYRWDGSTGRWEGHVRGLTFGDFDIANDEGYFVKCGTATTYVPGEGEVCTR